MKNGILALVAAALLLGAAIFIDSTENKYTISARVTYVDHANRYAILTDARGEMWEIYASKETRVDRCAVLHMDTNNTETVTDDIVERVMWR